MPNVYAENNAHAKTFANYCMTYHGKKPKCDETMKHSKDILGPIPCQL